MNEISENVREAYRRLLQTYDTTEPEYAIGIFLRDTLARAMAAEFCNQHRQPADWQAAAHRELMGEKGEGK